MENLVKQYELSAIESIASLRHTRAALLVVTAERDMFRERLHDALMRIAELEAPQLSLTVR